MKRITFVTIALIVFSCHEQSAEPSIDKSNSIEALNPIIVSDSLQIIVDLLTEYGAIDDKAVGYGGIKSDTYRCFEKLMQKATDDELIKLTDHHSPVIRGYSFWAMVEKDNPMVKEVMLKHTEDTILVRRFAGCISFPEPLNVFLLSIIAPNCIDIDCSRLPKKDIAEIKSKMKYPVVANHYNR